MSLESFILRSLHPTRELSAAKLADKFHSELAAYPEILRMRERLNEMVVEGRLVLSNEGKYRLTEAGRKLAEEFQ